MCDDAKRMCKALQQRHLLSNSASPVSQMRLGWMINPSSLPRQQEVQLLHGACRCHLLAQQTPERLGWRQPKISVKGTESISRTVHITDRDGGSDRARTCRACVLSDLTDVLDTFEWFSGSACARITRRDCCGFLAFAVGAIQARSCRTPLAER